MYQPISGYGIIGDCRSAALVSDQASIDWLCLSDFDSPALLLRLLDDEKGGYFQIQPQGYFKTHQKYLENTNILETVFFHHGGKVSITDFMPLSKTEDQTGNVAEFGTKIVRLIKSDLGNYHFILKLKITPQFAQQKVKIKKDEGMLIISDETYQYILYKKHHKVTILNEEIMVEFKLRQGEQEFFALDFYPKDYQIPDLTKQEINSICAKHYFETLDFWKSWASNCQYQGEYQKEVLRSALTLKLLTYSPTGAIVASPTTSLPEKIGGSLNWDYRYSWLRDASFTVYAFLGLGYFSEVKRFMEFLEKISLTESTMLKIMYGIRGEEELIEQTLPHLKGYMHSLPVRVGNAATNQKQFDVFGEVLVAINLYIDSGGKISDAMKDFIKRLIDYCCIHWREKDTGIWEARNGLRHNVYSKLMCWVGIDRGIRIGKRIKIKNVDFSFWEYHRDLIKKDILEHGFNRKIKSFTAYYDSAVLDSSILNIPIVGFLPADDPRVLSTIDNIMKRLNIDWFILRSSDSENKLQQGEGTFFLSTFWLIDCLSLLGRVDEAKLWLDKIIHDASPLGLYAEEFDPINKVHLGNYPHIFTHLGLINSCLNLKQAEQFGQEKKPTIQADRLTKVIKSFLNQKIF